MSLPVLVQTTNLNRVAVDPSLTDTLDLIKKEINLSLNCHAVGTIQSFNPVNQTVTATINYTRTIVTAVKGIYTETILKYPVLLDLPLFINQGGGASITFPIANGDECLIAFCDRDIDNWFATGQVGPVATQRFHSFADGIAFVGIRSLLRSMTSYDLVRMVLKGTGSAYIGVGPTLIKIANNTTTLNTLLQSLISTLSTLTTIPAVVGMPLTLNPTVISNLAALGAQIGGLLE